MRKCFLMAAVLVFMQMTGFAQETRGCPWTGARGIRETTADLMARQAARGELPITVSPRNRQRGRFPNRRNLPQNRDSPRSDAANLAALDAAPLPQSPVIAPLASQTLGLNFTAATLADTSAYPPDTMGVAGPSQFVLAVNGRIRSFDKTNGAMGTLNADLDVFFSSVRGADPTTDPRIRFDRLSGRWLVNCITDTAASNKVLLAVSDIGTINASTVWTYYAFQMDTVSPAGDTGGFADYPTLGVDANALYVGVTIFDASNNFAGASAFVIRKSSVVGGGPIIVTAFRNLTGGSPSGSGPAVPQGVDNYDPAATQGYFVGTDNASFGTLILRRVSNPGGTPAISGNIAITVPATALPIPVPHKGNNSTRYGQLDAIDDRLMAAHLRNGHLWTSQSIGVDNTGSATGTVTRNGARWYDLTNLSGTPGLVQSGTIFTANSSNVTTDRHCWMPTIMVSGQGHAAIGFSTAGNNEYINAATAGRLVTDAAGSMQTPALYTNSSTAYNPSGDTGRSFGVRRWGDYSMTSLDPADDMTLWTVQEFCNASGSYGVQVVKLIAPPPATPAACSPSVVLTGAVNTHVTVTGSSTSGSGFFDPGTGFTNRLSAGISGTGVTVNNVTYTDPTHLTLNLTVAANAAPGARSVTVTNPDSQAASSATGILTLIAPDANLANLVLSAGTLAPSFAGTVTAYSATVPNATSSLVVTPTAADSAATIRVNGSTVISGTASGAISLVVGTTTLTTVVTAQDGTTTKTYVVTVTRLSVLEEWRQTWFQSTENSGLGADTADPDHDGLTNLLEFATGSNPNIPTPPPGSLVRNGTNLEFTYPRSVGAMTLMTFSVEWSDTLRIGTWSNAGVSETLLSSNGTVQQVKAVIPTAGKFARFVRLRVMLP